MGKVVVIMEKDAMIIGKDAVIEAKDAVIESKDAALKAVVEKAIHALVASGVSEFDARARILGSFL